MAIDFIDSFDHKSVSSAGFGTSPLALGYWLDYYEYNTGNISHPSGRTGASRKFTYNASAGGQVIYGRFPTTTQKRCSAIYFKLPSNPSVQSKFLAFNSGPEESWSTLGSISFKTDGKLLAKAGSGGTEQTSSSSYSDNGWHRLDWYLDVSTDTWTLKWKVDGTAQTDSTTTGGGSSKHLVIVYVGSNSTDNCTFEVDDWVSASDGSTDYPINSGNAYNIGWLDPSAEGTHNNTSAYLKSEAGTTIGGAVTAYNRLYSWPWNTDYYVKAIGNDADDYVEVQYADTVETTILAVGAVVLGGACESSNPSGAHKLYTSGGTLVQELYSGNVGGGSSTVRGMNQLVAAPGGSWDASELNDLRLRMGYTSNTSGSSQPRWVETGLHYMYGAPTGGGGEALDPMGMMGFFGA